MIKTNIKNQKTEERHRVNMKYFFLHIEKTAGTTLVNYIKKAVGENNYYYARPEVLNDKKNITEVLSKHQAFSGHIRFDQIKNNFNDAFKITFLRHPINRIISFYYYAKEIPETKDPITVMSKKLNIVDFLQFCHEVNERRFVNGMTLKISSNVPKEKELISAKNNLDTIDFVGLQESFTESMHMLSFKTGWSPIQTTPRNNRTKAKNRDDKFSSKIIDKILEVNEKDLELYEAAQKRFSLMREKILYQAAINQLKAPY